MYEHNGHVCTVKLIKMKPTPGRTRCWFWADDAEAVPCLVVDATRDMQVNYSLLMPDGTVEDFMKNLVHFPII